MKSARAGLSRTFHLSTLLLFAACASPGSRAQDGPWYAALNGGRTTTDVRSAALRTALQDAGYCVCTLDSAAEDDADTGWKLTGGYSFNPYVALEASVADLGDFTAAANLVPAGAQLGTAALRGVSIDLVGTLPLATKLFAFGRLGLNRTRIRQEFATAATGAYFAEATERGTNPKYGLGLEYRLNDAFALRAEYERFQLDANRVTDDRADLLSLGVVYRFGRRAAAPAPAVAAPAPAPAPAQAPAPAREAPAPMRVTLDANALFDFDRAELRPEGRAELDALVRELAGLEYDVVLVTGHTDRIGTRSYNLALSERRANAVRSYLVEAGVPAGVITARGVNSDDPVTSPGQCQGPVSDALKACLQPDRRVEVEVTGIPEED